MIVGAEVAAMEEAAEVIARRRPQKPTRRSSDRGETRAADAVAAVGSDSCGCGRRGHPSADQRRHRGRKRPPTRRLRPGAANLIIAAADEAAAEAVAEDEAVVAAADEATAEAVAGTLRR